MAATKNRQKNTTGMGEQRALSGDHHCRHNELVSYSTYYSTRNRDGELRGDPGQTLLLPLGVCGVPRLRLHFHINKSWQRISIAINNHLRMQPQSCQGHAGDGVFSGPN